MGVRRVRTGAVEARHGGLASSDQQPPGSSVPGGLQRELSIYARCKSHRRLPTVGRLFPSPAQVAALGTAFSNPQSLRTLNESQHATAELAAELSSFLGGPEASAREAVAGDEDAAACISHALQAGTAVSPAPLLCRPGIILPPSARAVHSAGALPPRSSQRAQERAWPPAAVPWLQA